MNNFINQFFKKSSNSSFTISSSPIKDDEQNKFLFKFLFKKESKLFKYILGFVAIIIFSYIFNPFVVINAGHRGVVTNFGKVDQFDNSCYAKNS